MYQSCHFFVTNADSNDWIWPQWYNWQYTANRWCFAKRSITNCPVECPARLTRLRNELYSDSFHAVLAWNCGRAKCQCCAATVTVVVYMNQKEEVLSILYSFTPLIWISKQLCCLKCFWQNFCHKKSTQLKPFLSEVRFRSSGAAFL